MKCWNFFENLLSISSMSYKVKLIVLLFLAHLFCFKYFAQGESKKLEELFTELREDEKLTAECERKVREYQLAEFGKTLPKISGHCWDGCPTKIVLPYYPKEAKRLGISGQVKVETIVNEKGKVIYARVVKGQAFLSQGVKRAAYLSIYAPKKTCDDKQIKFRWTITYNFVLN